MFKISKKVVTLVSIALTIVLVFLMVWLNIRDTGSTVKVFMLEGLITDSSSATGITPKLARGYLDSTQDVGAIVVRINSPGGSVTASQEILDQLDRFKDKTGIPIIVSLGESATSGGYYIALGGDRIIANPGTLTGSIGVISQFICLEGLLEKLGLEREIVKSGKYKDIGVLPLTEDQLSIMQKLSDTVYNQFVTEVATRRNFSYKLIVNGIT